MSLTTLNLDKDLCRCCHAEGTFDDLAQPYHYDGKDEVYSDMIKESFNIELRPVPGHLCVMTYKICSLCIQRVRDAFQFRKQVQNCEVIFMDLYNKSNSLTKDSSLNNIVKVELSDSEDIKEDYSPLSNYEEEDYTTKMVVIHESDITKSSIKRSKSKSKPKTEPRRKKRKELKTQKIKEEERREDDAAEGSEPKKRKGAISENFTLTKGPDGSAVYSCKLCERTFKRRELFVQHHRHVHLKLRPKFRSCYLCKEKVPAHLRSFHMERAHGRPAPSCGACGKKFAYPFQVLQHQKNFHMGEKMFDCASCSLKFSNSSTLKRHEVVHSSSRPFKCAFCDRAFKWKKSLQTHIRMHLDERRHACTACQAAFVQQSSLKYHIKKHHPDMV